MDMTLSNDTVDRDAARGTVIGVFNLPVRLRVQAAPWFAVEGKNLVVAWDGGPPDIGDHDIRVHTMPAGPLMRFTIHVVAPAAKVPGPVPDAAPSKRRQPAPVGDVTPPAEPVTSTDPAP